MKQSQDDNGSGSGGGGLDLRVKVAAAPSRGGGISASPWTGGGCGGSGAQGIGSVLIDNGLLAFFPWRWLNLDPTQRPPWQRQMACSQRCWQSHGGASLVVEYQNILNWVVVSKIFYFHPIPGQMIQFDQYFSNGLKPPTLVKYPNLCGVHVAKHHAEQHPSTKKIKRKRGPAVRILLHWDRIVSRWSP